LKAVVRLSGVRKRWLSRRALLLHVAVVVWVPGCLVAFWWQVHRAMGGNGLSYLYSVEWPVFALIGIWAWWQLLHTDPETVGRRAQERLAAELAGAGAPALPGGGAANPLPAGLSASGQPSPSAPASPVRRRDDEDPELAAYNDRLARLAAEGPKTWRKR
jgi:hypothetical protein